MKKILLYNNYPFHHEMIALGLDYCRNRNYEAIVYNPNDHDNYMKVYSIFDYKYTMIDKIENTEQYDLIIVLSDCDKSFLKEWVTSKTMCINHWYCKRNTFINTQIPIAPFTSSSYNPIFTSPVFPAISKNEKLKIMPVNHIFVTVMGRFVPEDVEYLNFINKDANNVVYHIVSRTNHDNLKNNDNIFVYENIDAIDLYRIMANSHYILVTDINPFHNKGFSTSASIAHSFSTGCQLVIPEEMNKHLRLKSAIVYNRHKPLSLGNPDLDLVYEEREELIQKRDRILDEII